MTGFQELKALLQSVTVDQEIFMLKIIRVKIFWVATCKFLQFRSIRKKFLMVDDYNMD